MTNKQKQVLLRLILSAVLIVAVQFIPAAGWFRFALCLIPYLIIGYDILGRPPTASSAARSLTRTS